MIRIVNLRNYKPTVGEVLIKVDRSSVLGNPFYMSSEQYRDKVCDDYDKYFKSIIANKNNSKNKAFMQELRRIYSIAKTKDIALGCWCAPKRCHAITIKQFLEFYL